MVLTVMENYDLIALLLLKYRARAQSPCPCIEYRPPDREL